MSILWYIGFLSIATVISFFLGFYSWKKRSVIGSKEFFALMVFTGIWSFTSIFEAGVQTLEQKLFWAVASYLGSQFCAPVLFLFSLKYTHQRQTLPIWKIVMLFAMPVLAFFLAMTNSTHHWLWSNVYLHPVPGGVSAVYEHGLWIWVNVLYQYTLLLVSLLWLVRYFFFSKTSVFSLQSRLLFLSALFPFAANILYLLKAELLGGFDPTPIMFVVTNVFLLLAIVRFRLFELSPIAWEHIAGILDDAIVVLDTQKRIINWNPSFEKRFRIDSSWIGGKYTDFFLQYPQLTDRCKEDKKDHFELMLPLTADEATVMEVYVEVLRNQKKKITGKVLLFHDVTPFKKIQQALESARQDAERANQAKSRFLATMSHEIRNPLHGIGGLLSLLNLTELQSTQKEYVGKIQNALNSIHGIMRDILDFSKIEAGRIVIEDTIFDFRQIAKEVLDLFEPLAKEKGIQFVYSFPEEIPLYWKGDAFRIQQILTNLISNAIKFTAERGTVGLTFEIPQRLYPGMKKGLIFQVTDTGIGMSQDQQKTLFQPFSQVDATISRRYGGTGLGLSICKNLAELMGGKIEAQSELGKGSTFTLFLPLEESLTLPAPQAESLRPSTSSLKGKKVLLVEDEPILRAITEEMLKSFGLSVYTAADGRKALEVITHERIEIMLTDIHLPDIDGYTLSETIKKQLGENLIIIALSGSESVRSFENRATSPIDLFLLKPVPPARLLLALENAIYHHDKKEKITIDPPPATVVDFQFGLAMVDGDRKAFQRILEMFLESLNPLKEKILLSIANRDFEKIAQLLHQTKGTASGMGAFSLARSCMDLEETLKKDTSALEPANFNELFNKVDQLLISKEIKEFFIQ